MNIFPTAAFRAIALSLALPFSVFLVGCDMGSVDSTSAVVSDNAGTIYNFAGLYMNPNNGTSTNGLMPLVYPNGEGNRPSGKLIVSLRLLQYGEVLEAYDSAGMTWSGNITSVQSGSAQFSLRGRTTAGMSTEIAGTMVYSAQKSTMDATWIEPSYYGSLFAEATVSPATTNTPPVTAVSISPHSATLSTNGASQSFTASTTSGSSASFSWTLDGGIGTLSSATGSPVTVVRTSSGTGTLTVTSGSDSDIVSISCP